MFPVSVSDSRWVDRFAVRRRIPQHPLPELHHPLSAQCTLVAERELPHAFDLCFIAFLICALRSDALPLPNACVSSSRTASPRQHSAILVTVNAPPSPAAFALTLFQAPSTWSIFVNGSRDLLQFHRGVYGQRSSSASANCFFSSVGWPIYDYNYDWKPGIARTKSVKLVNSGGRVLPFLLFILIKSITQYTSMVR